PQTSNAVASAGDRASARSPVFFLLWYATCSIRSGSSRCRMPPARVCAMAASGVHTREHERFTDVGRCKPDSSIASARRLVAIRRCGGALVHTVIPPDDPDCRAYTPTVSHDDSGAARSGCLDTLLGARQRRASRRRRDDGNGGAWHLEGRCADLAERHALPARHHTAVSHVALGVDVW